MNDGEGKAKDGEEEAKDGKEEAQDGKEGATAPEEDAKDHEEDAQDSDDQDVEVIQSSPTLTQAEKVFRGLFPPAQKTPANSPTASSPVAPTPDREHRRRASKSDSRQKRPRTSDGKFK